MEKVENTAKKCLQNNFVKGANDETGREKHFLL